MHSVDHNLENSYKSKDFLDTIKSKKILLFYQKDVENVGKKKMVSVF